MALLTVQRALLSGKVVTYAAASAGGDTFPLEDNMALHVKNANASDCTVTVVVPGSTAYGLAQPDMTVTVAAGTERLIGPMDGGLVDSSTGVINVTYSITASVTVAVLRIP